MFSAKKITQYIFTHVLSHIYYTHTHMCWLAHLMLTHHPTEVHMSVAASKKNRQQLRLEPISNGNAPSAQLPRHRRSTSQFPPCSISLATGLPYYLLPIQPL
jgi:hypothetical protein